MRKIYVLLLILGLGSPAMLGQRCPPGPPQSPYDGTTDGTLLPNSGRQFNFEYAQTAGFDCFERLGAWFPENLTSSSAISPNHLVLDMAYASKGTAAFFNVQAPKKGNYTIAVRYAFAFGLFPGITDRPEGVMVNGVVITYNMHFPITYSFEDYDYSSITVPLNAGRNAIQFFNVTNHGVPRLDTMVITANKDSVCNDAPTTPGSLVAEAAIRGIKLSWTASTSPQACKIGYYDVYRSTKSAFVPSVSNQIGSGLKINSYNDTTALCGVTYYYLVQAVDTAGASASEERTASCSTGAEVQYEVESATVFDASKSSGPAYRVFSWNGFSDGQGTTLDATVAGQSVTITLYVPAAGVYDVKFATKTYATRGIVQLKINGANIGSTEDLYSNSAVWKLFDLGTVSLPLGKVPFVFTSINKNAASSGFTLALDYITLTKQ
jgi:hypothetical protein